MSHHATIPTFLREVARCARCGGELAESGDGLTCRSCEQHYPIVEGIPQLFVPNEWGPGKLDVTDIVKQFYEDTPFPNYDDLDNRDGLRESARRSVFMALLDEQIAPGALVLEAGCGTGQLSNFLGMHWNRRVIGADLCMNSLRLGRAFRERFAIVNTGFVQMNLFRPPFADNAFDLVVSNGVLHHTGDPEAGFRAIASKVKPGGHIIIGLYNWLGRLPTLWRRRAVELFGDRMAVLDRRLRRSALNLGRWKAWFRDQYQHPHESKHSIDEVLGWFRHNRIEFVSSIPLVGHADFDETVQLFEPHSMGTRLDHLSVELQMLVTGGADGGLYIMIGRKLG